MFFLVMQENWNFDCDMMIVNDVFVGNDEKIVILIFIVEYVVDDLRYVKLRVIREWKDYCFCYENVFYFYYLFLLFQVDNLMNGFEEKYFDG